MVRPACRSLNEDFTTYALRLSFLTHHRYVGDGVAERLISLPTNALNNPAFRSAGWLPDTQAVKRCYSPPIPTTGAAGVGDGAYFRAPSHLAHRTRARGVSLEDAGDDDSGGMVTGRGEGGGETVPAGTLMGVSERKRRQRTRREMLEEEYSSDLESEESEEDDGGKSAVRGIQFTKMPVRDRSNTAPSNSLYAELEKDGPALMVTSPSRPPEAVGQALRRGSLGMVEAVKQRARRDTGTSSEMSSDGEVLDPGVVGRKLPGRPEGQRKVHLAERIQEEVQVRRGGGRRRRRRWSRMRMKRGPRASWKSRMWGRRAIRAMSLMSMLGWWISSRCWGWELWVCRRRATSDDVSPLKPPIFTSSTNADRNAGPPGQVSSDIAPTVMMKPLPKLPPGRPISSIPPRSLISMALRGDTPGKSSERPFQRFADLSGKGESSPLWIKIYAPFSETPTEPLEVPIRRLNDNEKVRVTDLIGLSLWRYSEEGCQPPIADEDLNVNRWTLRIVEDEEVDFDFPALVRTRPVTDFTSNNNRPPQRRARDKPWDEFGLVRATGRTTTGE